MSSQQLHKSSRFAISKMFRKENKNTDTSKNDKRGTSVSVSSSRLGRIGSRSSLMFPSALRIAGPRKSITQRAKRIFSIFSTSPFQFANSDEVNEIEDLLLEDGFESDSDFSDDDDSFGMNIGTTNPRGGHISKQEKLPSRLVLDIGFDKEATGLVQLLIQESIQNSQKRQRRVRQESAVSSSSNLHAMDDDELIEISKWQLSCVIRKLGMDMSSSYIFSDMLWKIMKLDEKNESNGLTLHLALRYLFSTADDEAISVGEFGFSLFNSSQIGFLTLNELQTFFAYYCNLGVEHVIQFKSALTYFTKFMKNQQCLENLNFYRELHPFLRLNENEGKIPRDQAMTIYRTFIVENSMEELNIGSTTRKTLINYFANLDPEVTEVPAEIFSNTFHEIRRLMEMDSLPSFIKKLKASNKLAAKIFKDYKCTPVPGFEMNLFEELLEDYPRLKRHCEHCRYMVKEISSELLRSLNSQTGSSLTTKYSKIEDFADMKIIAKQS